MYVSMYLFKNKQRIYHGGGVVPLSTSKEYIMVVVSFR